MRAELAFCNGAVSAGVHHPSDEQITHDVPMHVGEAEVAACVAVGEAGVVDAELMEEGGMQVVDFDGVFDGVFAGVVGLTMDMAGLEAAACDPDGEAVAMMTTMSGERTTRRLRGRGR